MTTFATVVEAGSFTKAAQSLGLPKARVSQRVSDLEHLLGVRLLHRTTRSLNLTEDGKAYFPRCLAVLQEIDDFESALNSSASNPRGRVRIEALVSVARWVISPHLHEFKTMYPDLSVSLSSNDRISHLLDEGIDVAIRGGHLDDSSQIARYICDVQFGLYASALYFDHHDNLKHPHALHSHQLISWFGGQQNPFSWNLFSPSEQYEVTTRDGLHFDDPEVAIASCMAGGGICPGSPFAVEHWVRSGLLIPVLPNWSFAPKPIHLLYPTNKHLAPRVRCFVDWMLELAKRSHTIRMTPRELADSLSQ
ncbi:LysR family transcriptional regulator [Pseudomonas sp. CFBP 8770]|nr:LysR family transcriptional regulator [Pseudomonas sp. CFBP 8773]MBD8595929.1 LysR family transcriptional regulator [Pseudomonas sp. CFBP 8758]MBD8646312.1 LysR family transcriptional regulator [Pseudomonas sp. CFBP 8770]MBD8733532.1 LysR family transcriptional regulator [Pseudomonas sp. CFBP 13710]